MQAELFALSLVILLFSVIVHEVMHGMAALWFGDHTAEHAGRLTLNPLPHIDPIGSILMPLVAISFSFLAGGGPSFFLAWAKPVPVNPIRFSHIRLGEFVVASAGIVANLLMAVGYALAFHLFGQSFYPFLANVLTYAVVINLYLAVFNLLPIPPLDGSKIVGSLLPDQLGYRFQQLERYGFVVLLVLLFSPIGTFIFRLIYLLVNLLRGLLAV